MGTPTTSPMEFGTFTTIPEDVTSDCTFAVDFPVIKDNDMQIHIKPSDNSERATYAAFVERIEMRGLRQVPDGTAAHQHGVTAVCSRILRRGHFTWANAPGCFPAR